MKRIDTELDEAFAEFNRRSARRQYKEFAKSSLVVAFMAALCWLALVTTVQKLADVSAVYQKQLAEMKHV